MDRLPRHIDLLPAVVGLVPENSSPCLIQFLNRSVFFLQKLPERRRIAFRIKFIQLAVYLVIDLPSDNGRVTAVVGRGLFHDIAAQFLIYGGIVIVVPSCAVAVEQAVLIRVEHLRILLGQPDRRSRRRGAENDLHTFFLRQLQEGIKKFVGVRSFLRLNLVPRKFRNPDYLDPRLQHPLQIVLPQGRVPMLRIVASSHHEALSVYHFSHA